MGYECLHCFKALSVKTRFEIFCAIKASKGRVNISRLVTNTSLTQPTVTFHIDQLELAGLVKKTKSGRDVYCEINKRCAQCMIMRKNFTVFTS